MINHSIDDNNTFLVLKSYHSTIIMGSGQYDYHGFTIIAQPLAYMYNPSG